MTIRKRLALFFVSMLVLVTLMGAFFHIGGPVIVGAFRQSLDAMDTLNAIRELNTEIKMVRGAVTRYLLLDDGQEYLRFTEASKQAHQKLETLKSKFPKSPPAWLRNLSESYESADEVANRVAEEYKKGRKAKAHDEWSSVLAPKLHALAELVDATEHQNKSQADTTFQKIKNISGKLERVAIVGFLVVLVVGLVLFQSLYRAVMRPLEALERGAREFGKGHWDHKIILTSDNEFGALADAFNIMSENVKQLQLQTMHLDRMSAVGQLAGGVAHEINNPLTAVLGQTQILLAKTTEIDPHYSSLKKIENAALRCRKIVRGLLDFSRPTQASFEPVDLNAVIGDTLDLCEADLRKSKISIEKKLAPGLPKVSGSMSELQQVFLNLINNAIQAMPKGGTLILETRMVRKRMGAALPGEKSFIEAVVRDTGGGILDEHLGKVFEPFFTTKEIGKGTGLGLAVSLGIVKKHGGEMRVESPGLGLGASFFMTIPLADPRKVIRGGAS